MYLLEGILSLSNIDIFKKKVGCIITTLPFSVEQREAFDDVMDADKEEYPNVQIEDIVNHEWGINLKRTALSDHRRKRCSCFKSNNASTMENK